MAWWKQPPSVEGLYRKPYIIVTTIGFFFSTRRPNGRCISPFLIFPAVFLRSTCREARSSGRLLMAGCPHLWTFFFHFQRIFVKEMDTAGQPDPSLFERSTLSLFFRSRFFLCWRNGRPVRMSSSFFFIDLFFSPSNLPGMKRFWQFLLFTERFITRPSAQLLKLSSLDRPVSI